MIQGDIVLVHSPFTNFRDFKLRPAVIISNARFNKLANVILLAVSTKPGVSPYCMQLNQADLTEGNLLKKSYVYFSNILSLEKNLIVKKVARLDTKSLERVIKQLMSFII